MALITSLRIVLISEFINKSQSVSQIILAPILLCLAEPAPSETMATSLFLVERAQL